MSFTAKDVMALRQKTGMGMMDCKKALTENDGDAAAAVEWLRERMKGKMEERTERATGEGRIGIAVDGSKASIIEVQTETDFTARNEKFVEMVDDIVQMTMAQPAGDVSTDDAMDKRIDDVRLTTRENMSLTRGMRVDGGSFGSYVHHDGKRGVLLQLDGEAPDDVKRGICQHIVAMDPKGISEADVDATVIEEVRAEAIQEAKDTGKPEEIAGKIAEGRVKKYLAENTLLNQKYVLDESKSVQETLPSGVSVKQFIRYTLGG
ncbi:MAG: translation elongation factor Ts [Phycisphaerales bacterium]